MKISIHSLVKRETACNKIYKSNWGNFNPLPRKEGDDKLERLYTALNYFNPLPRKEGDIRTGDFEIPEPNFNPLPRKEGDQAEQLIAKAPIIQFQSTPS